MHELELGLAALLLEHAPVGGREQLEQSWLVTGAALATINRLPVLLLPGDTFATRAPHPVL